MRHGGAAKRPCLLVWMPPHQHAHHGINHAGGMLALSAVLCCVPCRAHAACTTSLPSRRIFVRSWRSGCAGCGYTVMLWLALCKWCRRMAGQACWLAAACNAALDLLLGVAAERQTMSLCVLLCPAAGLLHSKACAQLAVCHSAHPKGSAPWSESPAGRAHRALGTAPLCVGGRRHPQVPATAGGRPCCRNGELPRLRLP